MKIIFPIVARLFCCIQATLVPCCAAYAQDAESAYRERYLLVGKMLRAAVACASNKKEAKRFAESLAIIAGAEMKAYSRAFPKKTNEWMKDGAGLFNDKVASDGIPKACAFAQSELDRVNALKNPSSRPSAGASTKDQLDQPIEHEALLTGTCKAKWLNRDAFMPCDPDVTFTQFANHRSTVIFTASDRDVVFIFEGGKDRQPDLENYFLIVDKVRVGTIKDEKGLQGPAEGKCHLRMNGDASEFYEVKCDVFVRRDRLVFNFYLADIKSTKIISGAVP